jgi:CheY-like chemotaxis protein
MALPSNFRVLLADDDENDTFLIERAFDRLGWSRPLAVLSDGEQVIDYLLGQDDYSDRSMWPVPDLLVLDHWMPRLSGIDVLKWIRRQPRFFRLPVVLLSGGLSPRDTAAVSQVQVAYCSKPAACTEMMEVLKRGVETAFSLVLTSVPKGGSVPVALAAD